RQNDRPAPGDRAGSEAGSDGLNFAAAASTPAPGTTGERSRLQENSKSSVRTAEGLGRLRAATVSDADRLGWRPSGSEHDVAGDGHVPDLLSPHPLLRLLRAALHLLSLLLPLQF